ncbi:hypothetical protein Ga0080559_TMP3306 [Salipiger profundus]|uniref:Uncharacterized protein n=1 Tax=Salipiger profundus TaxID=1229727 RepID=A0A1U7D7L5_9RHOB|nr:hypothetical protein Ga0080559_TMP3306 [Salipiger profundus]
MGSCQGHAWGPVVLCLELLTMEASRGPGPSARCPPGGIGWQCVFPAAPTGSSG